MSDLVKIKERNSCIRIRLDTEHHDASGLVVAVVEVVLGDIEPSSADVEEQSVRPPSQLQRCDDVAYELQRRRQQRHATIDDVGDEHGRVAVDRQVTRDVKPARVWTRLPAVRVVGSPGVGTDRADAVDQAGVAAVGDDEPPALGLDRVPRRHQVVGERDVAQQVAASGELSDPAAAERAARHEHVVGPVH